MLITAADTEESHFTATQMLSLAYRLLAEREREREGRGRDGGTRIRHRTGLGFQLTLKVTVKVYDVHQIDLTNNTKNSLAG